MKKENLIKDRRGKRKTKKFILWAFITSVIVSPAFLFSDLKFALIFLLSIILFEAYVIWKEKIGKEILVALLFAGIITSYYSYQYTTQNILIGRINLFPLISWTFGLVFLREIYERLNIEKKILFITIFYWGLLFFLEYFFYHIFNVKLNSNYPGLFGLDFMHAQPGMKFFYIIAGPAYLLLAKYLNLK